MVHKVSDSIGLLQPAFSITLFTSLDLGLKQVDFFFKRIKKFIPFM